MHYSSRLPPCRADARPLRVQQLANRFSNAERAALLAAANEPEFGALPPSQIVLRIRATPQAVVAT